MSQLRGFNNLLPSPIDAARNLFDWAYRTPGLNANPIHVARDQLPSASSILPHDGTVLSPSRNDAINPDPSQAGPSAHALAAQGDVAPGVIPGERVRQGTPIEYQQPRAPGVLLGMSAAPYASGQYRTPLAPTDPVVTGGSPGQSFDILNGVTHTRTPIDGSGPAQTYDYSVSGGGRLQTPQTTALAEAQRFINSSVGEVPQVSRVMTGNSSTWEPTPQALALHQMNMEKYGQRMQTAQQALGEVLRNQLGQAGLGLQYQTELSPGGRVASDRLRAEAAARESNARYSSGGQRAQLQGESLRRQHEQGIITDEEFDRRLNEIFPPSPTPGSGANPLAPEELQPPLRGNNPLEDVSRRSPIAQRIRATMGDSIRPFRGQGQQAGQIVLPGSAVAGDQQRTQATNTIINNYLSRFSPQELEANYNDIIGAIVSNPNLGTDSFNNWSTTPTPLYSSLDTTAQQTHREIRDRLRRLHGIGLSSPGVGRTVMGAATGGYAGQQAPSRLIPTTLNR